MIRPFLLFTAFFLLATECSEEAPIPQDGRRVTCRCIGVHDGDTITVLTANKKEYKVRFAHIDCPEKGQPFGAVAKQFTADFCIGKSVIILSDGKKDRNGRIIGEVLNPNGMNLNMELVKAGLAWHFKKYSSNDEYAQLEIIARQGHRGLWKDSDPIAPWEWRKMK